MGSTRPMPMKAITTRRGRPRRLSVGATCGGGSLLLGGMRRAGGRHDALEDLDRLGKGGPLRGREPVEVGSDNTRAARPDVLQNRTAGRRDVDEHGSRVGG